MMKLLLVFGTRPEAIKLVPLIKEIQKRAHLSMKLAVTGQHREMLDQILTAFAIKPDWHLDLMRPGQSLSALSSRMMQGIDEILNLEKPDMVLVHGDTTTAFIGALSAFYHQIPIAHIEAGLRTYERYAPFPEEMNRQMIDDLATLYFAPTAKNAKYLKDEGKPEEDIYITGNTAIDTLSYTLQMPFQKSWREGARLVLLTVHRRENLGAPLQSIFQAIRQLIDLYPDISVIYPMHPNPKIRQVAWQWLSGHEQIQLLQPLDVIAFHHLIQACELILTDSGGIQEEAPALGKPVLVLRNSTERVEGVEAGTLQLVGTKTADIVTACRHVLDKPVCDAALRQAKNPYGDGRASWRIGNILEEWYEKKQCS